MKENYIEKKFEDKKTQWKFLRKFNNKNNQQIQNNISHNGKQVTSPKEIANIANNFFVNKIIQIREKFTNFNIDPIELLESLIPRNKNEFKIPKITIAQTQQI